LIITNLDVTASKLISSTMIFASMEGKLLHLYEYNHQIKLQALEKYSSNPPNGHFDHEDLMWEVII